MEKLFLTISTHTVVGLNYNDRLEHLLEELVSERQNRLIARLTKNAELKHPNASIDSSSEVDPNLLRMLDRGLEDIEAGRTLPHDEAMADVRRIREARRFGRLNTGVVANA